MATCSAKNLDNQDGIYELDLRGNHGGTKAPPYDWIFSNGKPDFTKGFDLAQHDLRLIPTDW